VKKRIFSREFLLSDLAFISYLALGKLLIHLLTNNNYGYFRDELYYLACGEEIDWGYVDQAPLIAVVAKASRLLFGDSLSAIRFLPALAGALLVFLTGLIVRELGGGKFAQLLAAIAVIIAPAYLIFHTLLSMNAFEPLFWMLGAYIFILIVKRDEPRLWLLFGLVAGIGLMNKHSMLFFGFGLAIGLLLTPWRKYLLNKWLWLGAVIAFLIFLPNIIWQISHNWPTLELFRNVDKGKNYENSLAEFFLGQILLIHPLTLPLWLTGIYFYLVTEEGKPFRVLGWCYVVMLVTFILLHGKIYYLAPAYPMLLASGAVTVEKFFSRPSFGWLRYATILILIIGGALIAPLSLPILPIETFISYSKVLGLTPPKTENLEMGVLPQHYADMFGWEEMADTVARIYESLPPEERAKCAIYTKNYGQFGAIDFFGRTRGLPKTISGHQNGYLWGPRGHTGEVMIVVDSDQEELEPLFESVELAAVIKHQYAMPHENNVHVFVCRKMRVNLADFWPRVKRYR
jgi:hypothetical protein